MLIMGFGFGYSSMRIHLLPLAMRVAKLSSLSLFSNDFTSGLISDLTSGGTSASVCDVFFKGVTTGVGWDACRCPSLLPCTLLFLGLGSVSVVIWKFLFLDGGVRGVWSQFATLCGGRE